MNPVTPSYVQRWFLAAVSFVLVLPFLAQVRPTGWWAVFSLPIAFVLGIATGWIHGFIVARLTLTKSLRVVLAAILAAALLSTLSVLQWYGTDRSASPTWFYEGGAER
jgi:branched-subunit amino acid ABC-type transport system permease component